MDIVIYFILGGLGLLIVFMILRTAFTTPPKIEKIDFTPRSLDEDKIAENLSKAIQIPTVTLQNNDMDGSVFYKYQEFLEKTYPAVMERAKKLLVNKYSVIYKIEGEDKDLLPIAILAHQDVVPAPPEGWEVPPFSGAIKDGYVYGRGSQDMKSQMIAALEGLEILLNEGFKPKRGIYFCFGHDEELRGTEGAAHITKYLEKQGVRFEFVLDEGGTILDGKVLGIDNKLALIGVCEKGYADILLEVNKTGGHASSPTKRTAVGLIAEAIYDIESTPRPTSWSRPTKDMIKALAPYMKPLYRFIFINRDILSPLIKKLFAVVSPFTNCLVRTTMAPTQVAGSDAPNVLPPKATANINCRITTGESAQMVRDYIQKVVGKKVSVKLEKGYIDPSPVSRTDSKGYEILTSTINEVFNGYVTAPFMFIAASDAKYYYNLSDSVYRFTPFEKSEDDASRIHATNERQDINSLIQGVNFYIRLYEKSCS